MLWGPPFSWHLQMAFNLRLPVALYFSLSPPSMTTKVLHWPCVYADPFAQPSILWQNSLYSEQTFFVFLETFFCSPCSDLSLILVFLSISHPNILVFTLSFVFFPFYSAFFSCPSAFQFSSIAVSFFIVGSGFRYFCMCIIFYKHRASVRLQ